MVFDPTVNRNVKDAVGDPGDEAAANSTDPNTLVALAKGQLAVLQGGVAVNGSQTDDAAFTPGTGKVLVLAGFADESAPDSVDEGDAGAVRMTLARALHINLRNSSGTEFSMSAGAAGAATLRIVSASDSPEVTSLAIMDDWDESDRCKTNPIVGQAGVAAGAGAVSATVQRVTLASDDPGVTSLQLLDDAVVADNAQFTDGTTKLHMSGYIYDEVAGTAVSENDAVAARVDIKRAIVHVIEDATTRGQRAAVSSAGAVAANIAQIAGSTAQSGSGTATGALRVEIANNGTGVVGLNAGSALIGRAAADATSATGGIPSTGRLLSASGSSGDATNVKASAGRVYAIQGYNASTSVRYLKLYNSASAPTAGSGTPVKTLALPPSAAFAFDWPLGLTFSSGIGFTLVTGVADNSSTSVTAADILALNIDYA